MNYNNYCSWKEKNIINSSSELHIAQIWWFLKGNIEYSLKLIEMTEAKDIMQIKITSN